MFVVHSIYFIIQILHIEIFAKIGISQSLRNADFTDLIKNPEANGDFGEDEKKDKESWKMFYQKIKT